MLCRRLLFWGMDNEVSLITDAFSRGTMDAWGKHNE